MNYSNPDDTEHSVYNDDNTTPDRYAPDQRVEPSVSNLDNPNNPGGYQPDALRVIPTRHVLQIVGSMVRISIANIPSRTFIGRFRQPLVMLICTCTPGATVCLSRRT